MKKIKESRKTRKGVHPAYRKDLAASAAVENAPLPELLVVSMAQHLGAPAVPAVEKKQEVLGGQVIAEAGGFISACVHAPSSGVVKSIESRPTPAGRNAQAVIIETDGQDRFVERRKPGKEWSAMSSEELVSLVKDAGIIGMGGAGFPTHVKLSPPPEKKIDTLIINGAECEPYLTADYRLMLECADEIRQGVEIIMRLLQPDNVRIAVEDNKPYAVKKKKKAFSGA